MHTELDANDNSLLSLESGLFLSTVLRSSGLFMHTELDANDNSFVESRIWSFLPAVLRRESRERGMYGH
jgi:hypothetical protein